MRASIRLMMHALSCLLGGTILAPSAAHAYRTYADENHGIDVPPRWESAPSFLLEVRDPEEGPSASAERSVARAFAVWSRAECELPAPEFAGYSETESRADGEILWASHHDVGLPRDAIAVTDIVVEGRDSNWRIVSAAIVMNDLVFDLYEGVGADLRAENEVRLDQVVAHELGHAIGFGHPCRGDFEVEASAPVCGDAHRNAIMNPFYFETSRVELSDDEQTGICEIYGEREPVGTGMHCSGCVEPDDGFGRACAVAGDCRSGVCVIESVRDVGFCSDVCSSNADCDADFVCDTVGRDGSYCVPTSAAACSAGRGSRSSFGTLVMLTMLAVLFARRPRESKR